MKRILSDMDMKLCDQILTEHSDEIQKNVNSQRGKALQVDQPKSPTLLKTLLSPAEQTKDIQKQSNSLLKEIEEEMKSVN